MRAQLAAKEAEIAALREALMSLTLSDKGRIVPDSMTVEAWSRTARAALEMSGVVK